MSDRLLVATRKGLFTVQRTAQRWSIARVAFTGDNVPMTLHDPRDGALYAALNHGHFGGKMHRSRDGGESWQEIGVPTYPERPKDAPAEIDPMQGKPLPNKLELVWELTPGGGDQPGRLWCGTIPGGLFRSDDAGETWNLVRSLWDHPGRKRWFGGGADWPGIHSVCVDPRDSRRVTLGVSCGGVWVSADDGASWNCRADGMIAEYMPPESRDDPGIQDPHRVVQCAAQPDCFWAQHHNGIFRSADGCQSWQPIENVKPSKFGFAVVVHPRHGDTAWFVPAIKDEKRIPVDARGVVTRTRDGGRSFETLHRGLPQQHAYDLVFRHALDIDSSGDRLAFGSTTGSLWVSEDGGDSWQTVSNHLPPVYCVRFMRA